MNHLQQAIQYYYATSVIADLASESGRGRAVPEPIQAHPKRWREDLRCAGCGDAISATTRYSLRGASCYHPACLSAPAGPQRSTVAAPQTRPVIATLFGHAAPLATWSHGPLSNTGGGDRYWIAPRAFGDLRGVSVPMRLDHLDHDLAADVKVTATDDDLAFTGRLYDTEINRDLVYARERIVGCSIGFTDLESRNVPSMDQHCGAKIADRVRLREISLVLPPRRPAFPCTYVTIIPRAAYA